MESSAPVLSTPAEHIFEDPTSAVLIPELRLSDEQLYLQYEIKRTVSEIREGRWKRVALQFPDDMLVDAPRVFERLRDGLKAERLQVRPPQVPAQVEDISNSLGDVKLDKQHTTEDAEERLCILADTSYGACCVDEIAAEHVDADVVVHYGRSCLSPTARLPVIYVFTSKPLDPDAAVSSFKQTYPDADSKVCLMADIPYHHHLPALASRLQAEGYTDVFQTSIIHDPSSLLPNRTLPPDVKQDAPESLREYAIFHISTPPTSLLLILSSRVRSIHIFSTDNNNTSSNAVEASTSALLRRRYALLTRLSTVPIFGILINTLSVKNYLSALRHCQDLITKAGKKSYVFVVGKVNAAKVANFSEIGGWVVIGCWESSLIESKDFWKPIITPFELEVALQDDDQRVWGGEWVADYGALLERERKGVSGGEVVREERHAGEGDCDEQASDDEPPEFDLRTGKYVSHSRPMGRPKQLSSVKPTADSTEPPKTSSALIQRSTKNDVASINGTLSPAAEFLRNKRTWQGLGTDYHEIAYERDEAGAIRGAGMEEGRSGVARGYAVGAGEVKR
ncbi:Diphthamide biosynthesis protein 2 [Elasticomyces elasticus]|nr:Diphthamide biosynthesis protein 2 [Elasticomyces elasticus]KAK3663507.1 Diphthamide biosynthesis protein 2 [Elasticomyces elasticus]KAK4927107.1 Diphthamide biosynthesis protein 2 [Elasticomyces elasticus]KAK5769028.1 Diphthamide biosynthesis protein 2 [Elasticomyces elasticus]